MRMTMKAIGVVLALIVFALVAGAIGSILVPDAAGPQNGTQQITYADFIAILLTAISLILTGLAFVIGIAAFVGWNSVSAKVTADVKIYLVEGFKPGNALHTLLVEEKNKIPYEGAAAITTEFEAEARAEEDKDY